jgi:hypothetical protein
VLRRIPGFELLLRARRHPLGRALLRPLRPLRPLTKRLLR